MQHNAWPKICNLCRFCVNKSDWPVLPYVGLQRDNHNKQTLEIRNCYCGATLSIMVNKN